MLQILMKWGEYSSDVQFILQRSEAPKQDANKSVTHEQKQQTDQKSPPLATHAHGVAGDGTIRNTNNSYQQQPPIVNNLNVNSNNNVTSVDRKSDLIGIVKGVQQQQQQQAAPGQLPKSPPPSVSPPPSIGTTDGNESIASSSSVSAMSSPQSSIASPQKAPLVIEFNSADVRNSLDRKTNALRNAINFSDESLDENLNVHHQMLRGSVSPSDMFKNCPPISSNGALAPPPYRNPPPPRNSPPTVGHSQPNSLGFVHQKSDSLSSTNSAGGSSGGGGGGGGYRSSRSNKFEFLKEMTPPLAGSKNGSFQGDFNSNLDGFNDIINENVLQNAQFRDLIQLISYQREKINSQQADITKVSKCCDFILEISQN